MPAYPDAVCSIITTLLGPSRHCLDLAEESAKELAEESAEIHRRSYCHIVFCLDNPRSPGSYWMNDLANTHRLRQPRSQAMVIPPTKASVATRVTRFSLLKV